MHIIETLAFIVSGAATLVVLWVVGKIISFSHTDTASTQTDWEQEEDDHLVRDESREDDEFVVSYNNGDYN